jgi:hypothetical protein
LADIRLVIPREFDEAWNSLELLSSEATLALANVKYNCNYLGRQTEGWNTSMRWQYRWPNSPPNELALTGDTIKDLEKYSEQLVRALHA